MINIGIVGFGLAAKVFHLPILTRMRDISISAVLSSKKESEIHEVLPGCHVYKGLSEFLGHEQLDIVLVLVPNDKHADIARQALEKNKHVVIDKPFVCNAVEGNALIDLAEKKNKLLTVYHNRRWDGDLLTVKKLIENNRLGEVTYFESRFDKYRPRVWGRWREQAREGAGLLYDLGSHIIDQALYLFGQPQKVFAQVLKQRDEALAPDYFDIHLFYANAPGMVRLRGSSLARNTPFRFYIEGKEGCYIKQSQDVQEQQMAENMSPYDDMWGKDKPENYGLFYRMPPNGDINNKEHDAPLDIVTERGCYQVFYENFIDSVQGRAELHVSAHEALNVVKVMELAMASSETGKVLVVE